MKKTACFPLIFLVFLFHFNSQADESALTMPPRRYVGTAGLLEPLPSFIGVGISYFFKPQWKASVSVASAIFGVTASAGVKYLRHPDRPLTAVFGVAFAYSYFSAYGSGLFSVTAPARVGALNLSAGAQWRMSERLYLEAGGNLMVFQSPGSVLSIPTVILPYGLVGWSL